MNYFSLHKCRIHYYVGALKNVSQLIKNEPVKQFFNIMNRFYYYVSVAS